MMKQGCYFANRGCTQPSTSYILKISYIRKIHPNLPYVLYPIYKENINSYELGIYEKCLPSHLSDHFYYVNGKYIKTIPFSLLKSINNELIRYGYVFTDGKYDNMMFSQEQDRYVITDRGAIRWAINKQGGLLQERFKDVLPRNFDIGGVDIKNLNWEYYEETYNYCDILKRR